MIRAQCLNQEGTSHLPPLTFHLTSHLVQVWFPLDFAADGTILPMETKESYTLELPDESA